MLNKSLIIFRDSIIDENMCFKSRSAMQNIINFYDCGYKRIYIIEEGDFSKECKDCDSRLKENFLKLLSNLLQSITRGQCITDTLFGIIKLDTSLESADAMPSPLIFTQIEKTYGADLDNSLVIGSTAQHNQAALEYGLNFMYSGEFTTDCVFC